MAVAAATALRQSVVFGDAAAAVDVAVEAMRKTVERVCWFGETSKYLCRRENPLCFV